MRVTRTRVARACHHLGAALPVRAARPRMHADCIFTDWTGFGSPISVRFQSIANIERTTFRNVDLAVEIADVSGEGAVRFADARFANVTLQHGKVVSTTANDYQQAQGYCLLYYAEDDAAYDVDLEPVPPEERGPLGEEFRIAEAVMSDCVWLLAAPDAVMPGCPPASIGARARVLARENPALFPELPMAGPGAFAEVPAAALGGDYAYEYVVHGDYGAADVDYVDYDLDAEDYRLQNDPTYMFQERLLRATDEWLEGVRQVCLQGFWSLMHASRLHA